MSRFVATTVLFCAALALPAFAAAEPLQLGESDAGLSDATRAIGVVGVVDAENVDESSSPEARNASAGTMCTDGAELWSLRARSTEPLLSWAALTSLAEAGSSATQAEPFGVRSASAASQERGSLWCVSADDPRCSPRPSGSLPLDSSMQPQLTGSVFVKAQPPLREASAVKLATTYQENARDGERGRIERPPRHAR